MYKIKEDLITFLGITLIVTAVTTTIYNHAFKPAQPTNQCQGMDMEALQSSLDAETTASGGYEIQAEEFCEL